MYTKSTCRCNDSTCSNISYTEPTKVCNSQKIGRPVKICKPICKCEESTCSNISHTESTQVYNSVKIGKLKCKCNDSTCSTISYTVPIKGYNPICRCKESTCSYLTNTKNDIEDDIEDDTEDVIEDDTEDDIEDDTEDDIVDRYLPRCLMHIRSDLNDHLVKRGLYEGLEECCQYIKNSIQYIKASESKKKRFFAK